MEKARTVDLSSLGGAICGGFIGIFLGALIGAVYGAFQGNVSLGLDGAILGGLLLTVAGGVYGTVLGLAEEVSLPRGRREREVVGEMAHRGPGSS